MRKETVTIISICLITLGMLSYLLFQEKKKSKNLEWEIDDLMTTIEEHGSQIDELNSELEDAISEKNNAVDSRDQYSQLLNEYLNAASAPTKTFTVDYSDYSSNGDSNFTNPSATNLSTSTSNTVSSINFDGGIIIKPTLGNLHFLLSMNSATFSIAMEKFNYSYSASEQFYVSEKTDNCCYTISKDYNSITMMFTKSITTDIETVLKSYNVANSYHNGFKKYLYTKDNGSYALRYKSSYDGLVVTLTEQ